MTKVGGMIVLAIALATHSAGWAQTFQSVELPSEDELVEALRLGDITSEQQLRLKDILTCCADSLPADMLEELTDLLYGQSTLDMASDKPQSRTKSRSTVSHRYLTRIHPDEQSWYYSSFDLSPAEHTRLRLKVRRNPSGGERFVSRSVDIRPKGVFVRRAMIGDFTTRFGLGAAFGYRGKLLSAEQLLSAESFLVPDQGGYNGALLEWTAGPLGGHHILSAVRDDRRRLVVSGNMVRLAGKSWQPYVTLGVIQLSERGTTNALTAPLNGLGLRHHYRDGSVEVETVMQPGRGDRARAVVLEGRHRQDGVLLRYTGWAYGDDFLDLTSGGKAAPISRRDTLETCDFTYSSRRIGQEGLVVEAKTNLSGAVSLDTRLLLAQFDRFRRRTEYAGGLRWSGRRGLQVVADYVGKWDTDADDGAEPVARHKCRLQARLKIGEITARAYIAGHAQTEKPGWMSLHADTKINLGRQNRLWLWSRFDRLHRDRLGYWYGFAQGEQRLSRYFSGVIKIAHVYSATSTRRHETTVSCEVRAEL